MLSEDLNRRDGRDVPLGLELRVEDGVEDLVGTVGEDHRGASDKDLVEAKINPRPYDKTRGH